MIRADLLEYLGSRVKVTLVEAHWKGGVPERHGGILKMVIRKAVEQTNVTDASEMEVILAEGVLSKNSLSRRAGFSPQQWVMGYEKALPGSIVDRPHDLASHAVIDAGGEFHKRAAIREACRHAWVALDNNARLRRSLLRDPRLSRKQYNPGDQVFFYWLQRRRRRPLASFLLMPLAGMVLRRSSGPQA